MGGVSRISARVETQPASGKKLATSTTTVLVRMVPVPIAVPSCLHRLALPTGTQTPYPAGVAGLAAPPGHPPARGSHPGAGPRQRGQSLSPEEFRAHGLAFVPVRL